MTSHGRIVHSQWEIHFNAQPEPRDRLRDIMMTKNYWGRNAGTPLISAVNPRRPVGGPTPSWSPDREGYICFCLLWMRPVSLPVFPISSETLCGREVGELSLLGLIYKKKRKKKPRADRVQWPSFLQAGMPVSRCHIGHSAASDFRAERAVCWVGDQMEGGCTAQLSSASFSLCWHTASPLVSPFPLSIHSFIQPILSLYALTLPAISQPDAISLWFIWRWKLKEQRKQSLQI